MISISAMNNVKSNWRRVSGTSGEKSYCTLYTEAVNIALTKVLLFVILEFEFGLDENGTPTFNG